MDYMDSTDLQEPSTDRRPVMPRAGLSGLERLTVPLLDGLNQRPRLKGAVHAVIGRFSVAWITYCTGNLWQLHGVERLARAHAPAGIILVANHRSFFDMFIAGAAMTAHTRHFKRLYFPVRKDYFYDNPLGLAVNMGVSGGSMWPPVFRDDRRALNAIGLQQLADVLEPGSVVGIHPEGSRNRSADPYALKPAKPGLGRLIRVVDSRTIVLPFFIAGLSNDVAHEIARNFRPPGERGVPVRMWFGEPIPARELQGLHDPQVMTDDVMARVAALGELDRAARAVDDSYV